jgi:hypothetical protein
MNEKHTLMGEDFFRTMMRLEDERRRRLVVGALWNVDDVESQASNIVSLERYRRERRVHGPVNKTVKPVV